jgi:hypothetical protein
MPLYKDLEGRVVDVSDEYAKGYGYEPYTAGQEAGDLKQAAFEARKADEAESAPVVAARNFASGATLGLSDVLTANTTTKQRREEILAGEEAHPYVATGANIAGTLAGALLVPEGAIAKTPAGAVSQATGRVFESGVERGGVRGTTQALAATGVEGAMQNAGAYIGHAALEDKDVTAEGLLGAAGVGFEFGAAGGGAAMGVEKGTIAARRMFSRVMKGAPEIADDAAVAWRKTSQDVVDANDQTMRVAQQRLADMQKAEQAANVERLRATAGLRDEQARAARIAGEPKPEPTAVPREPARAPVAGETDLVDQLMPRAAPVDKAPIEASPVVGGLEDLNAAVEKIPAKPVEKPSLDEGLGRVDRAAQEQKLGEQLKASVPSPDMPTATPVAEPKLSVKRVGDYRANTYEVTVNGATTKMPRAEVARTLADNLPSGFRPGAVDMSRATIREGVPEFGAINKDALYVVHPGELADKGVFGNEIKPKGVSEIHQAWKEGKNLDPIQIDVSKDGRYFVEDGNHRLMAAAEIDRPVVAQFRRQAADWKPQAGAREISSQILDALPGAAQQGVAGAVAMKAKPGSALGENFAKQRADLERALAEFQNARSGFLDRIVNESAAKEAPHMALRGAEGRVPTEFGPRGPLTPAGEARHLEPGDLEKLRRPATPTSEADTVVKHKSRAADLDAAHEEALARAETAKTDAERAAARDDAARAETQLAREAAPDNLVGDVARDADHVTRYEKAAADLAEAVGEGAHPVSVEQMKAWQKANDEAVRRVMDRTARAAEDAQTFGPREMSTKERVAGAREAKRAAESEHASAKAAKVEAKGAYDAARGEYRTSARDLKAREAAAKPVGRGRGVAKTLADVGMVDEILDVPGLPKPHDLPVVGPLLGVWLKYRAMKAALGRFTGRVPATADAKAAALAARVKDKVATSVDKMLGLVEVGARRAQPVVAPTVAAAISRRLYDDGLPDAKDKASLREQVAVRARELAAYVNAPNAIEDDVRREMRDVTDPDLIASVEASRRAAMQYLLDKSPKMPPDNPLAKQTFTPSGAEAMSFARRLAVVHDPTVALDAINGGTLTVDMSETLRATFPRLFALAQERMLIQAGKISGDVPYRTRAMMSMLFDQPLDRSLDPSSIKIVQTAYTPVPGGPTQQGPGPATAMPVPSLAGNVNINPLYQVPADHSR